MQRGQQETQARPLLTGHTQTVFPELVEESAERTQEVQPFRPSRLITDYGRDLGCTPMGNLPQEFELSRSAPRRLLWGQSMTEHYSLVYDFFNQLAIPDNAKVKSSGLGNGEITHNHRGFSEYMFS